MRTQVKITVLQKIIQCNKGVNPNPEMVTEAFIKLSELGYRIENQGKCLLAKLQEYSVLYSRVSHLFQCYYLGYGHCSVSCSLDDFTDSDQIILWQEQQKSMELKEIDPMMLRDDDEKPKKRVKETNSPNGRPKRLNDEMIEEMIALLKSGVTQSEVSRHFGISTPSVSYYKKKYIG